MWKRSKIWWSVKKHTFSVPSTKPSCSVRLTGVKGMEPPFAPAEAATPSATDRFSESAAGPPPDRESKISLRRAVCFSLSAKM